VPVEGTFDYKASISNDDALTLHAQLSGAMTAAMQFQGGKATPSVDASFAASGSVAAHEGRVTAGPEVQVGIGSLELNGHISEQVPKIDVRFGQNGCDIRLGGSLGAGLDAGFFHPSVTLLNPEIVLKRLTGDACFLGPSPTGGTGGGTGSGGGGTGSGGGGGGAMTLFPVPGAMLLNDVAAGPDGNMWFADEDGNRVGKITPGGAATEFLAPARGQRP
jgi:hypothetical protein